MINKKTVVIVSWVALLVPFRVLPESVADADIKKAVIRSGQYEDNAVWAKSLFESAFQASGPDRGRFARILCELATENPSDADRMIQCVGRYGTSTNLPCLYRFATNGNHKVAAFESILRVEGITSNSVGMIEGCFSLTDEKNRFQYEVCNRLILSFGKLPPSDPNRDYAMNVILGYMGSKNIYHDWLDQQMIRVDPTYSNSVRRLTVLRQSAARTSNSGDLNYITNAINDLVAYPEANLPD